MATQNDGVSNEPTVPAEFTTKHPLQHTWTWWFDSPKGKITQSSWANNLKKIYTFSTVEDFWCLWNNIKGAHELGPGSNYHVFKEGIEPKWEDPSNKKGGKWIIQIKNSQRETQLNQIWLYTVLACIGCSFEDDDEVCGVVVSLRKKDDKICLWTKNADSAEKCKRIGKQLREILGTTGRLQYQLHETSLQQNSSYTNKSKYEVS